MQGMGRNRRHPNPDRDVDADRRNGHHGSHLPCFDPGFFDPDTGLQGFQAPHHL